MATGGKNDSQLKSAVMARDWRSIALDIALMATERQSLAMTNY